MRRARMNDSPRWLRWFVTVVMIPSVVFVVITMAVILIALFFFLFGHIASLRTAFPTWRPVRLSINTVT